MLLWIWLKNSCCFSWDYLMLYNGKSNASPVAGKYCGHSLPPNFISATNRAFIHFHTDHIINQKGFELEYKAISRKLFQLHTEFCLFYVLFLLFWVLHEKKGEKFENQNMHVSKKEGITYIHFFSKCFTFFSKSVVGNHGSFCQFGGVGSMSSNETSSYSHLAVNYLSTLFYSF